jgi:hypothetical protein
MLSEKKKTGGVGMWRERGTDRYVISKVRLDKSKDGAAQEIFTGFELGKRRGIAVGR